MPGSPTTPDLRVLALTLPAVLPSVFAKNVGVRDKIFSRLNGWPVHSPADASPPPLRATAHGLGPMWIATPSSYRTCTDYSLPVSRRTAKDSARYRSGAYCETDVVNTYRVWLRYELFRARLTENGLQASEGNLRVGRVATPNHIWLTFKPRIRMRQLLRPVENSVRQERRV
jgi:hypothetical protein